MPNVLVRFIVRHIFKIIYTIGLTFVIIFLSTTKAPTELGIWHGTTRTLAILSVASILIGVIGVYYTCQKSFPKTLRSLGLWTLIPGVLALIISIYGSQFVYSYLENRISNFVMIKPAVDLYIKKRVPHVWILTISYLFLGIIFYFYGIRKQFRP